MTETIGDRYRVLRLLGEGAAARTMLAERLGTGEQVALKELRSEHLDGWKQYELFEREARVLASLDHPGVPDVVEFFQVASEDGRQRLYLAQELVDGHSLRERIQRGPRLGRDELVTVAVGVLSVLDYLHTRTPPVFHRDLKPSNIMVRADLSVVLIDFGGVCDAWRRDEVGSTVVATHGYTAPEQYLGVVGPASDLYSVGATLLEAATGDSPAAFASEATGRIELDGRDLPVAPALQEVILALLRPEPQQRPSVAEARARLRTPGPVAPGHELALRASRALAHAPSAAHLPVANAPVFVDMGPPPRSPTGPLADVYQVLIPPMWSLLAVTSSAGRYIAAAAIVLLTAGVILPVAWLAHRARVKRYEPLFVHGRFTVGHITQVGGMQTPFRYEFEVDGQRRRGELHVQPATAPCAANFAPGDRVAVLCDAADPDKSCFVFRRPGVGPHALGAPPAA